MTDDYTDVSVATDVSLVTDSSEAVDYGGEAADASKSLLVAARSRLRLVDVELTEMGLTFVFNRELSGPEEPWQHMFGVPMSKVIQSSPRVKVVSPKVEQQYDAFYEQHTQMRTVRDKEHYELSGERFTVTKGARAAYAAIRQELKDKHEFLREIDSEFQGLTAGQRAFSECFEARHNFAQFVRCLMVKARYQWEYIEELGLRVGGIEREKSRERHPVEPLDRTRVLALLEGMESNAYYLDYILFYRCLKTYRPKEPHTKTNPFTTQGCHTFRISKGDYDTAEKLISMPGIYERSYNCPGNPTPGARMGIRDVFTKSGQDYKELREIKFGGDDMEPDTPDVNQYFTALLQWDTKHCYGLLLELKILKDMMGMGSGELTEIPKAAYLWVLRSVEKPPYNRYPLKKDEDDLLDDVRKLDPKRK